MDVPSMQGSIALHIETYDRSDVSDTVGLPLSDAARFGARPSGRDAHRSRNASITRLPEDVVLLVNQLLDWRDGVQFGSTCVDLRHAMRVPLSQYASVAHLADPIRPWQVGRCLSQFATALGKIDAMLIASRPSALQLFVHRIARREHDFDVRFQQGGIYVMEAIAVWRTRQDGRVGMAGCRACWVKTEAAIKQALAVQPPGSPRHAALRQLCITKAYLPWLGLASNPRQHLSDILKDMETLPYAEWTDILMVLRPLLGVPIFRRLTSLFHDFATRVEEVHSPLPPPLLADVLSHLTQAFDPGAGHRALHARFPVSAAGDIAPIVAAVAQNIVQQTLIQHQHRSADVDDRQETASALFLRRLTAWDINDEGLARQITRCFVRGIAAQPTRFSADWSSLPPAMRRHHKEKVLGVSIDTIEGWGCSREITERFWPTFLDIAGASDCIGTTAVWKKIMSAPWQLQGVLLHRLWKGYGARSVEFDDDFASCMSSRCSEWEAVVSELAVRAGQPALALCGIRASVQWQSTCAEERADDWTSHERWDLEVCRPVYPWISIAGISVIKASASAPRMALVGVLAAMRTRIVEEGYLWCYDTFMFNLLRNFLCDPDASLLRPSRKVVRAISNVIVEVWRDIPDVGDETISRFDRLALRLDLNAADRMHVWSRVLMHLVIRIKSNERTLDETFLQGDASTPPERRALLYQLSRATS